MNELRVSFNHLAQKHSSNKGKGAFAVYVCIKLSVSYFILRSSNFWRKCPCYLKFGTHALKEILLKSVCTFLMKLFVSKDNFLLTKFSTNQNWPKSIKYNIAKTICVLKKRAHVFFKCYHKEHVFKIIKQKSITFLSWSSWKSNKDIFFEYFPRPVLRNVIQYEWLIFIWNESLIILYSSYIFNFF